METETARQLLYFFTTLAVAAWLAGLRFAVVTFRQPDPGANPQQPGDPVPPRGFVAGHAEVEGRPEDLSGRAAAILAKDGIGPGLPVKILERRDDRVEFEGVEFPMGNSTREPWIRRGQIRFAAAGPGRTAVDYAVAIAPGTKLRLLAAVFLMLGLAAVVIGFWLVHTYVVPHPFPAVRGQALQMLQVAHFLWPPFLFAGLQRMRYRMARVRLETLAHNLPYYEGNRDSTVSRGVV